MVIRTFCVAPALVSAHTELNLKLLVLTGRSDYVSILVAARHALRQRQRSAATVPSLVGGGSVARRAAGSMAEAPSSALLPLSIPDEVRATVFSSLPPGFPAAVASKLAGKVLLASKKGYNLGGGVVDASATSGALKHFSCVEFKAELAPSYVRNAATFDGPNAACASELQRWLFDIGLIEVRGMAGKNKVLRFKYLESEAEFCIDKRVALLAKFAVATGLDGLARSQLNVLIKDSWDFVPKSGVYELAADTVLVRLPAVIFHITKY
jgi:hypothetical protein